MTTSLHEFRSEQFHYSSAHMRLGNPMTQIKVTYDLRAGAYADMVIWRDFRRKTNPCWNGDEALNFS